MTHKDHDAESILEALEVWSGQDAVEHAVQEHERSTDGQQALR
jgi:hypothetical protein